jgi:iron complex transport system substrate-binding protein
MITSHLSSTHRRRSQRRVSTVAAASVALLALAGCGSQATAEPDATPSASAGYPVTVDNCGTEVTLDAAPERIVTIKSSTTELLLALGLGDSIVGAAALDGPVPEEFSADLEVIGDGVPGQEAVLALEPDLVYAGWESNFSDDGAGERDQLADFGVATYVSPAACRGEGYRPDQLTFDVLFDEIVEAGELFDARDAATELVAEQKAALDALEPIEGWPNALWYSSGRDTPYVGAGIGAPQMIMDAAGLDNIFGDVADSWTSVSWETVVEADPEVIVLVDSSWNTADSKIETLEAHPATAMLTAVREGNYVILPFAATEAGIRNVEAVGTAITQLEALGR